MLALAFASFATAILAPPPAHAAWPHDYHLLPTLVGSTGASSQSVDAAIADGSGGAYAFFGDDRLGNRDIYAVHLRGDGTLDPAWPATGLAICTAAGNQTAVRALDDGLGGLWVCWEDPRSGVAKIFATRVLKNATIDSDFPANGLALDILRANAQHDPSVC
jgi:hypothetical protein